MKWPWRSDRKFREREPRVPQRHDGGQAVYRYFPAGSSGGVSIDRIREGSRLAERFQQEHGLTVTEAAGIPGWRPYMKGA